MDNQELFIIEKLKATGSVLCTVESCTGGLLASLFTGVPGASAVFWGGWVTYDNSSKELLGVPEKLISKHGAVSEKVAKKLAEKGLFRMQKAIEKSKSYSLLNHKKLISTSITGIAGPSGGSFEKPLGLCYIAIAITDQKTQVFEFRTTPDPKSPGMMRHQIRDKFAQKALDLIQDQI